jgi:hypothetical protein
MHDCQAATHLSPYLEACLNVARQILLV